MNDTLTLVLTTAILGVSGVCLYLYKNENVKEYNDDYDSETLKEVFDEELEDDDFFQTNYKSRGNKSKTKRNKKNVRQTKRRY